MENNKPLAGVRVLDLSQFLAGPACTLTLGMHGAEILKVEQPGIGEQARTDGRPYVYGEQDLKWALIHSNKKSITLNLKSPEGKEILTQLIKICDIMIENFAPGAIERLGFGYDVVKEINPRIIFCSIKGYADESEYSKFPAMDGPVQATSGLASQTGLKGSNPVISNISLADAPTGDYAFMGIMLALYQREKTGRGQAVRINMQEAVLAYSRISFAVPPELNGRGNPMPFAGKRAPCGAFRCKPRFEGDNDNFVFINLGRKDWPNFCNIIGHPEITEDPRFLTDALRYDNVEDLTKYIEDWTTSLDKEEAMAVLCKAKITAGAVLTITDIANTPSMYESGFLQKFNHPYLGEIIVPTSALHLSESKVDLFAAPDLGQYNDEVYNGLLGIPEEVLAEYKEKKII